MQRRLLGSSARTCRLLSVSISSRTALGLVGGWRGDALAASKRYCASISLRNERPYITCNGLLQGPSLLENQRRLLHDRTLLNECGKHTLKLNSRLWLS